MRLKKAFNKSFIAFIYIPDQYKTQKMCDRIIYEDAFLIGYAPDQYKTQQSIMYIYFASQKYTVVIIEDL